MAADLPRRLRNRPLRWAACAGRPLFGLLAIGSTAGEFLGARALWRARPAVGPGWAAAVAAGLALPVVLMAAAWLARRRRMVNRALWWAVAVAAGNGSSLLYLPLTRAWMAGALATMLPACAVAAVLCGWHAVGYRLYLGIVERDGDGWRATVLRDQTPAGTVAAATPAGAAAAAKARIRELRPRARPVTAVHIVIAPWPDTGAEYDTWYRVGGSPGRLTAACRRGPRVRGSTVEELLAAIERTAATDLSRTALLWPGGPAPSWPAKSRENGT